ncbi:MAG: DNA translocase FtsK 4TM domain-containing protein [Proteobacteria bacterium]|nr:DNA translocase FtsK 4TM domain-containing protein [Pseudomonadota bacterium]MBU4130904.1 DNA translocase FtsK 4TM domain-containing protein [Pseudomonadota bacterium]
MKKELYGILLLFSIILTAVSLFSYDAADPCIGNNFSTVPPIVHNLFGLVGAHVAGAFVYLFGLGALWVPLVLSLISIWYLKERSSRIIWLTLAGGLVLMISTGSILFLFKDAYGFSHTIISAGGVIGRELSAFLLKYTNIIGCITILIFFMVIGFTLATGISLVALALFVYQKTLLLMGTVQEDFREFTDYIKIRINRFKEDRNQAKLNRANTLHGKGGPAQEEIDITPIAAVKKPMIKIPEKLSQKNQESIPLDDLFAPTIVALEPDDVEYVCDPVIKDIRGKTEFILPKLSFLDEKPKIHRQIDTQVLQEKARILEEKLKDFNVAGEVVEILPGPVITTFEYRPAPGIKLSKIVGLSDDLALALSAISIRIVAPIPGRDVVGIEIPNEERELVNLREMISSKAFVQSKSLLTLGLGKDLLGQPVATQMDKMPHLLIAGATGTGKSVGLNSMIISLLYKATPDEVKLIMIDPKRIELSVYNDIPHLISPVVTDMKKATNALFWAVREMERRYELLEESGLRNLDQYNEMVREEMKKWSLMADDANKLPPPPEPLPFIVVIVDELGDLMMVASKDVEYALTRLAQMARAAGIHIILATQRPSADVLTGTIKANFPTRISFQVSSKIDARIIIDQGGAESLLGNGDMLFCPPGTGKLMRIQGAYISEKEIAKITGFLKEQRKPDYDESVTMGDADEETKEFDDADYDAKYDEAVALVTQSRQASISYVQRRMRIGYNRAARLIEMMEHEGIVGPQIGAKQREVLVRNFDDD